MITIVNGSSKNYQYSADMIFTDPPFDMKAKELNEIISNYNADHLLLITVISQYTEFAKLTNYNFSLDFVLDHVIPKKSRSTSQPNFTHSNVIYMRKKGVKSVFNRKLRQRSDVATQGFYPTIFRASKNQKEYAYAKNLQAITDLLGSFEVNSVIDLFGGAGTIAHACAELNMDCTTIEIKKELTDNLYREMSFMRGVECQYLNQ